MLFVFASSDYDDLVARATSGVSLTANKKILVFESRREFGEGISSFQISMYGASFLAGATAASLCEEGGKDALVVLANPTDSPIALAGDGFMAGYGRTCDTEYLSDDWKGYVSASHAYQKMYGWASEYSFIFPVAGGSNSGIYRYSREFGECPFLAGMDVDQSSLSDRIAGCVIKHIDRLVYEYLDGWRQSGKLPESKVYDLECRSSRPGISSKSSKERKAKACRRLSILLKTTTCSYTGADTAHRAPCAGTRPKMQSRAMICRLRSHRCTMPVPTGRC